MTDKEKQARVHKAKIELLKALGEAEGLEVRLDSALVENEVYIDSYLRTVMQITPPRREREVVREDAELAGARDAAVAARRAMIRDAELAWDPKSEHRVKRPA